MRSKISTILFGFLNIVFIRIIKSRTNLVICLLVVFLIFCHGGRIAISTYKYNKHREDAKVLHKLNIESRIKREKGTGCSIPKLDPFTKEIMHFMNKLPEIACSQKDWVTCDGNQCYVVKEILNQMPDTKCHFSDIIYINDDQYYIDTPIKITGSQRFNFTKSDHVKVFCLADNRDPTLFLVPSWNGIKTGFRPISVTVPPGREDSPNVLVLTFDSISHNQFLRSVPLSYKILTEELGAVVLNNYNIVGEGTAGALFPILTGKTELEFPDTRRKPNNIFLKHLNPEDFLFGQLHHDGYYTAYFEDLPAIGTFTLRYNGFKHQPTDHYLRSFFLEDFKMKLTDKKDYFCVGDTPTFLLMMDHSHNFMKREGKRFGFTVISDIAHEGPTIFSTVEYDLSELLRSFKANGLLENTLLIIMSDHGSRIPPIRMTYQGKIEERLPLMSIVLPEKLKRARPDAETSLKANADVLTTPFDIHTTILDAVGLKDLSNNYTVPGADLPRGMSLLEPIPKSRSCPEADVLTHWCVCLNWTDVPPDEPIFNKVAHVLADFIKNLTNENNKCASRILTGIEWVRQENVNDQVLKFRDINTENYVPIFTKSVTRSIEFYQVKILMMPMNAAFEGTVTYLRNLGEFFVSEQDISRVNAYGRESQCIIKTHPHLRKYCYCKSCFRRKHECSFNFNQTHNYELLSTGAK